MVSALVIDFIFNTCMLYLHSEISEKGFFLIELADQSHYIEVAQGAILYGTKHEI